MSFVLCDRGDEEQIQDLLSKQEDTTTFDLVFGLQCCGGVAEAAVELALTCQALFCVAYVSACCFRSNEILASLSRLSEETVSSKHDSSHTPPEERQRQLYQHRQDHCAIQAINAMRLIAAEERVDTSNC
jgi:hypothetical protein